MRILTIGAGAVGGYFGGRLVEAGRDVTFLVRGQRAEQMHKNGLRILSAHGDLNVRPRAITAEQIAGTYDLILLAVKSYALEAAMNDFSRAVGPATVILPALNGMRHMEILSARFGSDRLFGGVCRVAAEIDGDGRIRQLAEFQSLSYGEIDGSRTPRLEQAGLVLSGSGFDASISEHIVQDMWDKWVQLAALGAINSLFRGSVGQIVSVAGGAGLCLMLLHECEAIARACRYPPSRSLLERLAAELTAQGSPMTSSMYRDLKRGLPVEAEPIVGDLLERGRRHDVKAPLLEAAFVNLSVYQRAREQKAV